MKSNSPSIDIKISRAVEEPIEATFEQGEQLQNYSGNLKKLVIAGILGCIFTILCLSRNVGYIIIKFIELAQGNASISAFDFFMLILSALMFIIIIALTLTVILYLIQINKFYRHLTSRFALVSELKTAPEKGDTKKKSREIVEVDLGEDDEGSKRHKKNPIFAMLDLVEESMHEIPQLIRLMNISKLFLAAVLIFIEINIITEFVWDQSLLLILGYWELVLSDFVLLFIFITIALLWNSGKMFSYMRARHDIIDSIKFGKTSVVPKGKDRVRRLIKHLSKSDPFIKHYGAADTGWKIGAVSKTGSSGKAHEFDAYFSAENKLAQLSDKLCIPRGHFSVFIKVFPSEITKKSIQDFRAAVIDVTKADKSFPLRIIALQSEISEIDDEVYNYVLENPIGIKGCGSHLQIIAEDGDIYSFIPQVSYGTDVSEIEKSQAGQ